MTPRPASLSLTLIFPCREIATVNKLTDKQRAFVANKAAGMPHRAAAIEAGYAENAAEVTAAKLVKRKDIKDAIAAARKALGATEEKDTPRLRDNYSSSLELLRDVYNNPRMSDSVRIDAAFKALPYEHARIGESGKKAKAKERAGEVMNQRSKYTPISSPPHLTVVKSKE